MFGFDYYAYLTDMMVSNGTDSFLEKRGVLPESFD